MLYRFTYCQWDDNVEVTYSTVEDPDEEQIVLLEHGADPFQNEEFELETVPFKGHSSELSDLLVLD